MPSEAQRLQCPECDTELRLDGARARCPACSYSTRLGTGPRGLRRRDGVALAVGSVGFVGLTLELLSLDAFGQTFADLGEALPWATLLVAQTALPAWLMVASAPGLIGGVWLRRRGFAAGGPLLAVSAAVSLAGALFCLFAFYLPALRLAEAVP